MSNVPVRNRQTLVKNGSLLNHFFTQAVWCKMMQEGAHSLLDAILRQYAPEDLDYKRMTYGEIFSWLYDFMRENWRNEYVFRNELINHYFYEQKPQGDIVALAQLPIADARADFVVINGEGVVYEIKTDRDNLDRLDSQLANYYKAFTKVYVVVGDGLLQEVRRKLRQTATGIMHLTADGHLVMIRRASPRISELDPNAMFRILRKSEFDAILLKTYGHLPNVPSMDYYPAARQMFVQIPMTTLRYEFERQLKSRIKDVQVMSTFSGLSALTYFWSGGETVVRKIAQLSKRKYRRESRNSRGGIRNGAEVLPIF